MVSVRHRIEHLEARLGVAGPNARAVGFVKPYDLGAPMLTEAERLAVDRGAVVCWIPRNGRELSPSCAPAASPIA